MIAFLASICILLFQDNAPYKPSDEFELKMDYELRTRPLPDHYSVDYEEKKEPIGPLPYLGLRLKILTAQPGEERVKIVSNLRDTVLSKKIKKDTDYSWELGFTADMKERITAHEYTIFFQSSDKQTISRIVIHVAEDGTFRVNDENRGRL